MAEEVSILTEQNRRLLQEVKRRTNQMAAINVVTSVVGQSLDLDKTLATALEVALEIVDAEASGISLLDEDAGELVLRAQRGWIHDFVVSQPMRIPIERGMSGEVMTRDDIVVYNNLIGHEDYAVPSFRDEHFRSIAMAPMHARGRIIGILSIMSNEPDRFDEDIVSVLRVVADTVGVALENARLYSESIEQRQRMEAILYSTTDGILATDRNGKITLVNIAAERLLGVTRGSLIGAPLRQAPINNHIRNQLLKALTSHEQGHGKAFQATLDDNRVIAATVSPVMSDVQYATSMPQDGWVIVLQDVTHLRRAEIARAQFMQAASHDMRNPLSITQSSIITLDKLIKERDEAIDELIELALGGVERLHTLIDDLTQLEHIELGYNFRVEAFSLLDLCHEIDKESRPLMAKKDIRLMMQVQENMPLLHADVRWFKRAVRSYLANAAQYSPPGGEVVMRVFTDGDMMAVEVEDKGPGIPVHAQARVFDRFYRVDGSRIEGSGLGLAIVKAVAEVHGGHVYLRSKMTEGSTFGFVLPIMPSEEVKRDIILEQESKPVTKFF